MVFQGAPLLVAFKGTQRKAEVCFGVTGVSGKVKDVGHNSWSLEARLWFVLSEGSVG